MRLLLDEHISPAVASALERYGVDAVSLRDWSAGRLRGLSDEQLLEAANLDQRILVTFDLRTIPSLLKEWAETGRDHAGVIFVDERTVSQGDAGNLARALATSLDRIGPVSGSNLAIFVTRARSSG